MLDWSYNLLPEAERVILRRLSVFVGAFSLEAAQFVAAGDILEREQVAEAIAALSTKSLIAVETNRTGALYRLLDTTRAYVLTKMVDSGERNTIAQRHATYYREFLERIETASLTCAKNDGTAGRQKGRYRARGSISSALS